MFHVGWRLSILFGDHNFYDARLSCSGDFRSDLFPYQNVYLFLQHFTQTHREKESGETWKMKLILIEWKCSFYAAILVFFLYGIFKHLYPHSPSSIS